jgi:hypothetical protein
LTTPSEKTQLDLGDVDHRAGQLAGGGQQSERGIRLRIDANAGVELAGVALQENV